MDAEQAVTTQSAIVKISNQIRRSLDFSVICETATAEMRSLLEVDRVSIYRFNSDWSGCFIAESADSKWVSLVEAQHNNDLISKNVSECSAKLLNNYATADTHLQATDGGSFVKGEVFRVCEDIYNAGFSDCYIEVLQSYEARAYVIIAIYLDNQLWGLLAAYQNTGPRQWKDTEVQLLIQVAEQLGIALKQSEYVETIQQQTRKLENALQALKQSQAQLVHGEKMASLGQLVAGIAHEINNPINFIHANLPHVESYVDSVLTLIPNTPNQTALASEAQAASEDDVDLGFILEDLPKLIGSMHAGSARIREIILSLRNFSRLDESGVKQINLHSGIESTLVVLNHQFAASSKHPKIEIVKDYGDLPPVECDPAQINQAILAILTNAIYSVKSSYQEKSGDLRDRHTPQIRISTATSSPGQVVIRIQDNGVGVEEKHQSKVFDHFFTTKPVGQGVGLGLAIARQIIEESHQGTISLDTSVKQGAAFVIHIPVSRRA